MRSSQVSLHYLPIYRACIDGEVGYHYYAQASRFTYYYYYEREKPPAFLTMLSVYRTE